MKYYINVELTTLGGQAISINGAPLTLRGAIQMALESQPADKGQNGYAARPPTMEEIMRRLSIAAKIGGDEADLSAEDLVAIKEAARIGLSMPVLMALTAALEAPAG